VRILRQPNGGKASALNNGLAVVSTPHFVSIDADTQVLPDTIGHILGTLTAGSAAAVSGQMLIGNRRPRNPAVVAAQVREYDNANNIERRALSRVNLVSVVPGAIGGFDCATVRSLGGYPTGTLAEDAGLTMMLLARGHRVVHEPRAVVLTEAPDEARGLLKQRVRWATGKLQVLLQTHGEASRHGAAVRGLWWHAALAESILPLLTPLLILGTPVCFLFTLAVALRPGSHGGATAALVASVVVTGLQAAAAIGSARTARTLSEQVRPSLWLPAAGNPLAGALILAGIGFVAVLRAWHTVLTGRSTAWNKLERTGDVVAVPYAGTDFVTPGSRHAL
jgi:cellulose synthase/poly-beta-1,6-N-acetylglucosamine synthase-like glycosyltransferase